MILQSTCILGAVLAGMSLFMSGLWYLQKKWNDASVVDVAWAFGVGASAISFAAAGNGDPVRRIILGCIGGLWSARLTFYLLFNRVVGKGEDGRYRALREGWGGHAQRNFFIFFQCQALFVIMFSFPFAPCAFHPGGHIAWAVAGAAWGLVAIGCEALADAQLAGFRARPENKGHTCRDGLWRYSRHPNYFFEWLHWFAYILLSVGGDNTWLAWMGPVIVLLFLYRITGIPYTEAQALRSRGDEYRKYQQSTSAFIPWFPKRD